MKALNLTKHTYLVPHPEISPFTICQICPDLNPARAVTLEPVAFLIYELGLWFPPHTLPSFNHACIHLVFMSCMFVCVCEYTRTMVHMS